MSERPKRPMSAYFLWLNSVREQIKAENPGIKVTEIAKLGGQMWQNLADKSVWQEQAAKLKEKYLKDLEEYNAKNGSGEGRVNRSSRFSSSSSDDDDEDTE
ncbi:high mobility group protein D-like [Cydia pomonella]|uniref:high mobility group protein D-like n=1 Tax=Cydia pomonella TaxID=82600 RepID=UPI002ADE8707|nr:high mobility group protein D-like [Cydia pomonella]